MTGIRATVRESGCLHAARLSHGVDYIGADTSGRLGFVLGAAEITTVQVPATFVQGTHCGRYFSAEPRAIADDREQGWT